MFLGIVYILLPAIADSAIGHGQPLDAGGMFAQSVPLIHKQGV
jgi:hypothetical protein